MSDLATITATGTGVTDFFSVISDICKIKTKRADVIAKLHALSEITITKTENGDTKNLYFLLMFFIHMEEVG